MIAYYFDTSALIKRHITETGSGWVRQPFQPPHDHLFITCRLTMPEMRSAFARRQREGSVSQKSYTTNIRAFKHDSMTSYRFIELTGELGKTRQTAAKWDVGATSLGGDIGEGGYGR